MIFVLAEQEPALFVMLSEDDVKGMREGQTRVIAQRQLQGHQFDRLIVSLSPTDAMSLEAIKQTPSGRQAMREKGMQVAEPKPGESVCRRCKGIMEPHLLLDERCIVCWAAIAKNLQGMAN